MRYQVSLSSRAASTNTQMRRSGGAPLGTLLGHDATLGAAVDKDFEGDAVDLRCSSTPQQSVQTWRLACLMGENHACMVSLSSGTWQYRAGVGINHIAGMHAVASAALQAS